MRAMFHWNRRVALLLALVLVGLFTANFAFRAVQHARVLRARPDEPIQPWMNVPYIAHAYHVRPEVVAQAIQLPPGQRDPRPIWQIARDQGRTPEELKADILAGIAAWRAANPPGAPKAPPPPPASPAPSDGSAP